MATRAALERAAVDPSQVERCCRARAAGGFRSEHRTPGRAPGGSSRHRFRSDDQHGVRVEPAGGRVRRARDRARRLRGGGRRGHRVDEPNAATSSTRKMGDGGIAWGTSRSSMRCIATGSRARSRDDHGRDGGGPRAGNTASRVTSRTPTRWRHSRRAGAAIGAGRFADEIAPVIVADQKGRDTTVSADEHPRPDTTIEQLENCPRFSATSKAAPASSRPAPRRGSRTAAPRSC